MLTTALIRALTAHRAFIPLLAWLAARSADRSCNIEHGAANRLLGRQVPHGVPRVHGGELQYFQARGDANESPNSRGWTTELGYLPIPNVKLALRYSAYPQFNGARDNYDGFGRNAKDNNSVFLLIWALLRAMRVQ
jgi:hypothetical protein